MIRDFTVAALLMGAGVLLSASIIIAIDEAINRWERRR